MKRKKNIIKVYEGWDSVSHLELRAIDVLECNAYNPEGLSTQEMLKRALEHSTEAYTVYNDNKIVAVFGVCEDMHLMGIPWLLASEDFEFSKSDLKLADTIVSIWAKRYSDLYNRMHVLNVKSKRFLTMLGFKFEEEPDESGMIGFSLT